MDNFKYKIALEEIVQVGTAKKLNFLIRQYNSMIPAYNHIIAEKIKQNKQGIFNIYKLYSFAIKQYEQKSKAKLPDFIYTDKKKFEKQFHSILETESKFLTFDEYLDLFQFTNSVQLPYTTTFRSNLIALVGDNKLPFIYTNLCRELNQFERCAYSEEHNVYHRLKQIIANVRAQQTIPKGTNSTILKLEYAELLDSLPSNSSKAYLEDTLTLLDQHKAAIQTTLNTLNFKESV